MKGYDIQLSTDPIYFVFIAFYFAEKLRPPTHPTLVRQGGLTSLQRGELSVILSPDQ